MVDGQQRNHSLIQMQITDEGGESAWSTGNAKIELMSPLKLIKEDRTDIGSTWLIGIDIDALRRELEGLLPR
ncbi:MAG: hypothetical protein NTY09_00940 [bacterium]|nr:hypothetical protein [bacterium]